MTDRPLNPVLLATLSLEAEAISTVLVEVLDHGFTDLSHQAAAWEPRPCPSRDEWK